MSRVYNFSAGPAQIPEEVLKEAQNELLDWQHSGMSVMEMPHRGQDFKNIAELAEQDLRDLLSIPTNYKVLFLHGGGRSQFSMVPMNLANKAACMAYAATGTWSNFALQEATRYGKVKLVASGENHNFTDIPPQADWDIPKDAAYLHYTDNETIQGVEFSDTPQSNGLPLVADMSSNLLSKPLDISRFGLIYACAQKNIGPAGITVVIIREDLLEREPMPMTPTMFQYAIHANANSLYNTPATFPWYVSGLVFKWIKKHGGVEKMAQNAKARSDMLYQYIDQSDFYANPVNLNCRSRMNVVFTLADANLDQKFLKDAEAKGLTNLKGHRSIGGMRASMYNSMPQKGVELLLEFMRDFEKHNL